MKVSGRTLSIEKCDSRAWGKKKLYFITNQTARRLLFSSQIFKHAPLRFF
ncbi:hypothetical protein CLV60_114106 [Dyadobacter jiangsuensis]|uniref:Uncharacterized protein n=1 Tax=Dyadobacter jiangsuensis TaxID=1591085 RepID=A0A2P8FRE3_9BACT|nr:hypothetical protein CLV60_114106 [Dyadobacter jiangsuensis]